MGGNKRKRGHNQGGDFDNSSSIRVVLDDDTAPPFCEHGPTVLFCRDSDDASKFFYAWDQCYKTFWPRE
jgi:hypothetical protein